MFIIIVPWPFILLFIRDNSSYKNNKVTPCYVLMNVPPGKSAHPAIFCKFVLVIERKGETNTQYESLTQEQWKDDV